MAAKQTSDEEDACHFTSLSLYFCTLQVLINVPLLGDDVSLGVRASRRLRFPRRPPLVSRRCGRFYLQIGGFKG